MLATCRWLIGLTMIVAALGAKASTKTECIYLSGRDAASAVPWEFRVSAGARAGEWATLPVPSNWELHGFGTLSYHSTTPSESGEYRHRFVVPKEWAGARIKLVFDGVMTDARVSVNGRPARPVHQGGFYRFSYDVTNLVRCGEENLLEVAVYETSSNDGVNRAERTGDYWNFGGIFRPVWLEVSPPQAIERLAIDARADGAFSVDVFVEGEGSAAQVEVQVFGRDGSPVGPAWRSPLHHPAESQQPRTWSDRTTFVARLTGMVAAPLTWTAETPHLYAAEVRLLDAAGTELHRRRARFGFRTFEIRRGDGFYLNGQRIVLQGANRHSFNASTGRALSEVDHREDIRLMKEMNATAVRMSHYPPDERFLELCDELGLYVLDELAGWQKSYDTAVGRQLLAAMVQRDVNHPSVLLWDNGNEGGWNTELDDDFAKWDPQRRPVLHPWQIFSGVNTAHYRLYPQLPALVAGLETAWRYDPNDAGKRREQPLIYLPTEFLHGLYDGGAGAGMEDYWTLMRSGKTFGGGFVWAWMDEGVRRPDTGEIDVHGNQAPDGILGPRREREASFYTLKELWSPIAVVAPQGRELSDDFDGRLTIENRHSFTNTSECRFAWELRRLPESRQDESKAKPQATGIAAGVAVAPQIAPGARGELQLALPENWRDADVLALRVEDPSGRELWTTTWALPGVERFAGIAMEGASPDAAKARNQITGGTPVPRGMGVPPMSAIEQPGALVVTASELVVRFDRITGALAEIGRRDKKLSLGSGLRALTQSSVLSSLTTRAEGGDYVISCRYGNGDERVAAPAGLRSVEWRVRADGWIDCAYLYAGTKGSTFQGVGFDLPGAEIRGKSWVGDGPYRVWQNRRRGVTLGAWSTAYNDTITGWRGFEYPEFKGFFSGVRWLTLDTTAGSLTIVPQTPGLFVQVMRPDLPPVELQAKTALALPDADLGVLHAIPAIGTKFSRPEEMGPQGQTPEVQPEYRGAFSLKWESP
ncbi:glycoside hydrolase family 2 sugar binding [Opitutus terrae PB90-1]|uniref:beta-galactosidase n=2 Tax=Opitutus terrae TaxID=107709 RepID=B1ZR81_OPITP|nr:glycoside hydrolase family 2 sugar binding [Opitutus terrae PB90-1]